MEDPSERWEDLGLVEVLHGSIVNWRFGKDRQLVE